MTLDPVAEDVYQLDPADLRQTGSRRDADAAKRRRHFPERKCALVASRRPAGQIEDGAGDPNGAGVEIDVGPLEGSESPRRAPVRAGEG